MKRIRLDFDPHLEGMSSSQIAKMRRGIIVSSSFRGVRLDNLSETVTFTSAWFLTSFLTSLSEAEAIRSEEFGENATGKWHSDRAQFYKLAAGAIFKHRKRIFLENRMQIKTHTTVDLPDMGEDSVVVRLNLPTGEIVDIMYTAHYGSIDIVLEKKCEAICYDREPEIAIVKGRKAVAETDQIMISVGPTREK